MEANKNKKSAVSVEVSISLQLRELCVFLAADNGRGLIHIAAVPWRILPALCSY
jgi:hypothetical protein